MTRINVFRYPGWAVKFFIGLGVVLTLLGIVLFIIVTADGFDTDFLSGDWSPVFQIFQGVLFIVMGASEYISRKYYIEWDDEELRFLMPKMKFQGAIKFADIISFQVRLFEIRIRLPGGIRVLDLDNLQFEDLRKVKEKFKMLAGRSQD